MLRGGGCGVFWTQQGPGTRKSSFVRHTLTFDVDFVTGCANEGTYTHMLHLYNTCTLPTAFCALASILGGSFACCGHAAGVQLTYSDHNAATAAHLQQTHWERCCAWPTPRVHRAFRSCRCLCVQQRLAIHITAQLRASALACLHNVETLFRDPALHIRPVPPLLASLPN